MPKSLGFRVLGLGIQKRLGFGTPEGLGFGNLKGFRVLGNPKRI